MVDAIKGPGAISAVATGKGVQAPEGKKKAETNSSAPADEVKISAEAQNLQQIEKTAKDVGKFLSASNQSLGLDPGFAKAESL